MAGDNQKTKAVQETIKKYKNYTPEKGFVNFRTEDPVVKRMIETLIDSAVDLSNYRNKRKKLKAAYENPFDTDLGLTENSTASGTLRSPFIMTAVDQYRKGMIFPEDFKFEAKDNTDPEAKTKVSMLNALREWCIRTSDIELRYDEAKEPWAAYGDAYIAFYSKTGRSRKGRGAGDSAKNGKKYMMCEEVDGCNILLDTSATYVHGDSTSKSSNFIATTDIYTDQDIKREFGAWVLKVASCGSHVDHDGYADRQTNNEYKKVVNDYSDQKYENSIYKYYEVVRYWSCGEEVEMVTIGANAFPIMRYVEGDNGTTVAKKIKKEYREYLDYKDQYIHRNYYGEPELPVYNLSFFWSRDSIRNKGLAQKLYPVQVGHEIQENAKLDTVRKRMVEYQYVVGGSPDRVKAMINDFKAKYKKDIFSILHIPMMTSTSGGNSLPVLGTLRYEGITPELARQSTDDIYTLGKDVAGVPLRIGEVQSGLGVGQSMLLEEDRVENVKQIVDNNIPNIKKMLIGMMDFVINNKGFGSMEELSFYREEKNENEEEPKVVGRQSKTVTEICKELEDFEFDVYFDQNKLIRRSEVLMAEQITKMLQFINPQVNPEAYKIALRRLAEIYRIDIPLSTLAGIENMKPQGGASQFELGGAQAQLPQNQMSAVDQFLNGGQPATGVA